MVAVLLMAALGAHAEEGVSAKAGGSALDLFEARLRYGVWLRSGKQTDAGPSLSYNGLTPNDLALSAWGWFLVDNHVGAFLSLQREGFALYEGDARRTGGALIRFSVGPTGRVNL